MSDDGTPITKPIEDVRVGETVLSRDQYDEGDDLDMEPVARVFRHTSDHLRVLTIQDDDGNVETIRTTNEHPFYVEGQGWTGAKDLAAGALLAEPDGSDAVVLSSVYEAHPEGVTVFNFEVTGDHTYFVEDGHGAGDSVWVHNDCVGRKFLSRYKGKPVEFEGAKPTTFFRRDKDSYDLVYNEFQSSARKNWIKKIASEESSITQLEAARMTEKQIQNMRDFGKLPAKEWQVHHKQAIELGGGNDDDNLMIFRPADAMYHSAITTAQKDIWGAMAVGDSVKRAFPMFEGVVIFDR
jgi:hypothetical protein